MNAPNGAQRDTDPAVLTLMEAAAILRIGRTTAYELAKQYLHTNGATGLPVIRVGKQLRVQRSRLDEVIEHGTGRPHGRRTTRPPEPNAVDDKLQLFPLRWAGVVTVKFGQACHARADWWR